MTGRPLQLVLFAGALVAASPLAAQEFEDCIILQSGTTRAVGDSINRMVFISGGARFRCRDGRTIRSDSVAQYRSTGIIDFVGNVRFTDPQNILTASFVRYLEQQNQAVAQGDVVLTDRETGSIIEAPVMNYYRESPERPEALIQITSGRPHAMLVSIARADSTQRDTTVVDSDRMEIIGRSRFTGHGNVIMVRDSVRGTGQSATFDRDANRMRFWTSARMETDEMTLTGDTINGITDEDDRLEEVTALRNAHLTSEEVNVDAPTIRVFFEEGEVSRLVAVGETTEPVAGDSLVDLTKLASAISEDFRLAADSIDAVAPKRVLERVTAVGNAYGERLGEDLANANVPAIASRDWMRGDTVIATFIEGPPAPDDTTGAPTREVESVVAIGVGERARSSYRVFDDEKPDEPPGINYMLARRIVVNMKDGGVSTVSATGEVQGMYLQVELPPTTATAGTQGTGNGRSRR